MTAPLRRRVFLGTATGVAAAPLVSAISADPAVSAEPAGSGGTFGSTAAAPSAAVARPVRPFALKDVPLGNGLFATKRPTFRADLAFGVGTAPGTATPMPGGR